MATPRVLSIVLAGGEGKRLMPLTMDRAKPAVPFGGTYRLIDYVLSNLTNAGMRQIAVLTQYKSHSLDRHISLTWRMSTLLGNYVTPVPAQQRLGPRWYQGSADAIFQSMNLINDENPDYVVVFGADNIYRMDVSQMLDAHIDGGLSLHGRRHPGAAQPGDGVRRDRRGGGQQDQRLPREAGRAARAPRRSGSLLRVDGQLHLHRRRLDRGTDHRCGEHGLPSRHGRRHHPGLRRQGRCPGLRLHEERRAGDDGAGQGLLARRRHHRRLPRGAHGPRVDRPGVQPVQPGLAHLDLSGAGPGREVHAGRDGHRLDREPGVHHLRRHHRRLGDLSRTSASSRTPGSTSRCC